MSEDQSLQNEDGNATRPGLPRLRIPEEYRSGFAKLVGLGAESFQELFSVLREEPPAMDYRELSSRIAPKMSTLSANDVRDILETLDSLYLVRSESTLDIPDFAEAVRRAVQEDEELELPTEERVRFQERMTLLLDLNSLDATSKALDVLLEHQHTLHDLRVMTDIRPVFGRDPKDAPTGAMIVHLLKISYHEADEIKELFVALDTGDPDILIRQLERAKQKAESLKRVLGTTKVPYIDAG